MGMILDTNGRVHAEARRESFVIYDDFGKGFSVELEWDWLDDLEEAVRELREHRNEESKHAR